MGSVKVEVNLPSIDRAEDFLRKKYIKTLGQAALDTTDMMKENFAKGKTGAGEAMPALSHGYKVYKANKVGRYKRDLYGPGRKKTKKSKGSVGGAMLASMKPKKKTADSWVITFSGAELDKARYNQDAINKKSKMRFMSVSKKWVAKMTEQFNKAMKRYMR